MVPQLQRAIKVSYEKPVFFTLFCVLILFLHTMWPWTGHGVWLEVRRETPISSAASPWRLARRLWWRWASLSVGLSFKRRFHVSEAADRSFRRVAASPRCTCSWSWKVRTTLRTTSESCTTAGKQLGFSSSSSSRSSCETYPTDRMPDLLQLVKGWWSCTQPSWRIKRRRGVGVHGKHRLGSDAVKAPWRSSDEKALGALQAQMWHVHRPSDFQRMRRMRKKNPQDCCAQAAQVVCYSGSFICLNVACVVLYFLLSIYWLGGWDSGVARVSPKMSTTSWSHHLGRLVWGTSAFELSRVPWLLSSVSRNVVQMPVFLASHLRFSYSLQVDFQKNKPSHQSMMSMISKLGWFVGCDPGIHWRCWTCLEIAIMTLMMTVI